MKTKDKKKRNIGIFLVIIVSIIAITYSTGLTDFLGLDPVSLVGTLIGASIGAVAGPGGIFIGGAAGNLIVNGKDVNAIAPLIALAVIGIGALGGGLLGGLIGGGQCSTWVPPEDSKCEICDDNPFQPCNEYKCRSLGKYCQYISEGQKCVEVEISDFTSPNIDDCQVKQYPTAEDYGITKTDRTCTLTNPIQEYTTAVIKLETDEFSLCAVSPDPGKDLEKDVASFGQIGTGYDWEHYIIYEPVGITTNYGKFYVRCKDYWGNKMTYDYVINFNLQEGRDIYGPAIFETSLENGGVLFKGTTELDFFIHASDPSGVKSCKFSKEEKAYNQMTDTFTCQEKDESGIKYWECSTKFTNLQPANKYYFVCEDNLGNTNSPYPFSFSIDDQELQVAISQPSNGATLKERTDLVVGVTGAYNDEAICTYNYGVGEATTPGGALTRNGAIYKGSMDFLDYADNAKYVVNVSCDDEGGDEADAQISLNVENNPLTMTISPSSGSASTVKNVDITVTTNGGKYNDGKADCYYDTKLIAPTNLEGNLHKATISLNVGLNNFKIRCSDKNALGNIVEQDLGITFNTDALEIDSKGFDNKGSGTFELYVETKDGYDKNGVGECYFAKFEGRAIDPRLDDNGMNAVYNTKFDVNPGYVSIGGVSGKRHTKSVSGLRPGIEYNFYIKCKDSIGFVTEKQLITITPPTTSVVCTSDLQCDTGEICNAYGVCVSSGDDEIIIGTGPLTVLSIGPAGNIGNKNVRLYISLNGGADEFGRNLNCYYNTEYKQPFERSTGISLTEFNDFFNTNRLDQSEVLDSSNGGPGTRYYKMLSLANGNYIYYAACKDSADTVSSVRRISFSISEDNSAPIMQFYTEGSLFKVRLNERGSCLVKQGNSFVDMSADSNGLVHSTPVRTDKTYMIRCKDSWNNWRPGPTENEFITVVKNG